MHMNELRLIKFIKSNYVKQSMDKIQNFVRAECYFFVIQLHTKPLST
jgi:hypothetical protein